MSYETIRLETIGETVIVYFAPTFEVVPQDQNDIFQTPRSADRSTVVRDNGLWTSELTVQGAFVHSDEMDSDFREATQDLFGQQTVTPQDQINRLREFTVYSEPSALRFYHRDNEYRATTESDVDIADGVYPAVSVTELRMPEEGETSAVRTEFLVRLSIGVSRQSEPEEPDV